MPRGSAERLRLTGWTLVKTKAEATPRWRRRSLKVISGPNGEAEPHRTAERPSRAYSMLIWPLDNVFILVELIAFVILFVFIELFIVIAINHHLHAAG